MRCRPGDLAMILPPHVACGHFVDVLRAARSGPERLHGIVFGGNSDPAWVVAGRIPFPHLGVVTLAAISDSSLQPIRDPGPEAVDETLTWLPVPCQAVTA